MKDSQYSMKQGAFLVHNKGNIYNHYNKLMLFPI